MTTTATLERALAMQSRKEIIATIKTALESRSGKRWSVTGGKGTAYGWITISSPPARRERYDYMSDADRAELAALLGFDKPVHMQGEDIPSSSRHYAEYIDRAEGREPQVLGEQYWD